MKKVLLRAPLLTNSGYGVHSRQIFTWLNSLEDVDLTVECLQWGRTSWILDQEQENGLIGKIMDKSNPIQNEKYDITFQVQLPDEWDEKLGKINVGVTALVETDRCSQDWVQHCNKMNHVIVPSTFTKNVLKRSGQLTTDIVVIQEWFNSDLLNKSKLSKHENDKRFDNITTDFNILVIGTLTSQIEKDDRKNIKNTIKWLCEEFKGEKNVGVILKTNFGKGTSEDKLICKNYLKNILKEFEVNDGPKVYLLHGNMKKEEVASLITHKKIKMYATATRGEGYGLPLIEAAVAGKPIVATGWSGHLEFLDKEYFGSVDYDLVEILDSRIDDRIFQKGFKWAEPVEASFKKEAREIYENYDKAKDNAKVMKKNIQFKFNKDAIKKKYSEYFNRMLNK